MTNNKLFERALKDKCPVCNKPLDGETEVVEYGEGKLEVHKRHIKYKETK